MTLRCVRGALRPSCASPPRPAHARRSASAPRTCPHFFPFGSRNQSDQFVPLKSWGPTGGRAGESGTQCVWAGGRPAGISGGRFRLGVSKAPRGTPSARARSQPAPIPSKSFAPAAPRSEAVALGNTWHGPGPGKEARLSSGVPNCPATEFPSGAGAHTPATEARYRAQFRIQRKTFKMSTFSPFKSAFPGRSVA